MTQPEPVVFIVDDDEEVRDSLQRLLESVNLAFECFAGAEDFLEAYQPDRPGCVLADVRMPGMSGLQLQEELKARSIELPVILLSGYADVPMVIRAMKAGAADFIEKPFNSQALLDRVQTVIKESAKTFADQTKRREFRQRLERLTKRQRQVLDLIVTGVPNKRIAFELVLSEKTIETHRAHIMEKMRAKAPVDLATMLILANTDRESPSTS